MVCSLIYYLILFIAVLIAKGFMFVFLNMCSFQQAEEDCSKAILLDKKVSGQVCYTEWSMQNIF
jgi:hypothetical protein